MFTQQINDLLTVSMEAGLNDSLVAHDGFSLARTAALVVLFAGGDCAPTRSAGRHKVLERH